MRSKNSLMRAAFAVKISTFSVTFVRSATERSRS